MNENVPAHYENAATLATENLHVSEGDAPQVTSLARARPRPDGRLRVAVSEVGEEPMQVLECEAEPAPAGARAKPRPAGRERSGPADSSAPAPGNGQAGGALVEPVLGELVALRSGGPTMTVVGLRSESAQVECGWFHNGEYRSALLPKAALVPAHAPGSRASA
jgi:uncharacterized protein YodC (DUF2158 family)